MTLIEKLIARQCIADLLSAGFYITVHDGEEDVLVDSRQPDVVLAAMGMADQDYLNVCTKTGPRNRKPMGWVHFIYGNSGPDVISNYTTGLEKVIVKTEELSNKLDSNDIDSVLAIVLENDPARKELASLRLSVRRIAEVLDNGTNGLGDPKLEVPPEGQERGWNALCAAICDRIEGDRRY